MNNKTYSSTEEDNWNNDQFTARYMIQTLIAAAVMTVLFFLMFALVKIWKKWAKKRVPNSDNVEN